MNYNSKIILVFYNVINKAWKVFHLRVFCRLLNLDAKSEINFMTLQKRKLILHIL